jgi:hypothetical protein
VDALWHSDDHGQLADIINEVLDLYDAELSTAPAPTKAPPRRKVLGAAKA